MRQLPPNFKRVEHTAKPGDKVVVNKDKEVIQVQEEKKNEEKKNEEKKNEEK